MNYANVCVPEMTKVIAFSRVNTFPTELIGTEFWREKNQFMKKSIFMKYDAHAVAHKQKCLKTDLTCLFD